jgi:thioredoxin family protein
VKSAEKPARAFGWQPTSAIQQPASATARDRRAARTGLNHWALAGEWANGRQNVVLDQAGGSIAYRFHARDAHLVLSPGAREPIPFRVLLDGEAPGLSHGVDVDEDGNGLLREGRLYQLVRQHDGVGERTLEIAFLEPAPKRTRSHSARYAG